jgi:hypothetical protein
MYYRNSITPTIAKMPVIITTTSISTSEKPRGRRTWARQALLKTAQC